MEEYPIQNLIAQYDAVPKRRVLRSDGALYVVLLAVVIGVILTGNALMARFDWPRAIVQISLYLVLFVLALIVYRRCLVSYRYTLTDRMLSVSRIVGRKERAEASVRLSDVTRVCDVSALGEPSGRKQALYVNARRDAVAVCARTKAGEVTLLLSPDEAFREHLNAQWKIARK